MESDFIRLQHCFTQQQRAARQHPSPTLAQRQGDLTALAQLLLEYQHALQQALAADFSHRSVIETQLAEIFPSLQAIKDAKKRLPRWIKSEKRHVSLWFQPARAQVMPQPLGVVGIIVPWNYPLYLSFGPLVAALAAGNRAMLKLSEYTPQTAIVLQQAFHRYFSEDKIAIITGDAAVAAIFAQQPWDHLFFTGSTTVGHKVMQAAATNLTPVTLELGGKSPVFIASDADIAHAAERIAVGKLLNAGQTCVAPDYVWVHESQQAAFIAHYQRAVGRYYPRLQHNPDYTAIIHPQHKQRLHALLEEAVGQGAEVIEINPAQEDLGTSQKLAPYLVCQTHPSMRLMQEEIFGPILPVVTYRAEEEVLTFLQTQPRPLALYLFDRNRQRIQRFLQHTHSGGVTINDTVLHVAQDDLPFGGIGASGMGHYHGYEGFLTFSKLKPVFEVGRYSPLPWLSPPYGKLVNTLLRLMLRK